MRLVVAAAAAAAVVLHYGLKNLILFKKMFENSKIKRLKYYSLTVTHGKTFVYDFCVL